MLDFILKVIGVWVRHVNARSLLKTTYKVTQTRFHETNPQTLLLSGRGTAVNLQIELIFVKEGAWLKQLGPIRRRVCARIDLVHDGRAARKFGHHDLPRRL
jgi:hypothetical protein